MEDELKKGKELFSEGRHKEAQKCFEAVIQEDPRNKEAYNNLGVIAYRQGEMGRSFDLITYALTLDPFYREAILNFSEILRPMDQLAQIVPFLEKVIQKFPDDRRYADLLAEARSKNVIRTNDNTMLALAQNVSGKAFFVLSTGLCGTGTLSQLLATSRNAKVHCYPELHFIQEALHAYWGETDKEKLFLSARSPAIKKTWTEGYIYGETSAFITPFCNLLPEELPESRFIILTRHPKDFVRSGLRRNFYHGHPFDDGLLRPSPKSEAFKEWKKQSQFEKICWLWRETYVAIERMLEKVRKERVLVLRFEDLISDVGKAREVFEFLGLEGFNEQRAAEVLSAKLNAQDYRHFPGPETWSSDLSELLESFCWPSASRYGYSVPPSNHLPARSRKEGPKVSIGLPLYSGGTNLADAIESILSQDFESIELIISDHGSDPFVKEVCLHYQRMDGRLKYYATGDRINYLGIQNMSRMVELSHAPYFMWGSYDDRIERSFVRKCLEKMGEDEAIALVYPRSKILDKHSKYLSIGDDRVKADQEDRFERFMHVIWELKLCNAFYGLFRQPIVRKTRSLRKNAYAHDNLFLAEIALLGKIVQIEDVLFIRQLKRDYNVPLDQHHADVLYSADPALLEEGISLPFCRLTYSHCELINYSEAPVEMKDKLTREIIRCFRHRWERQLKYEIERAIQLVNQKCFYHTWDNRTYNKSLWGKADDLQYFHVTDVMKCLREALFIYPEWVELREAFAACVQAAEDLCSPDRSLPAAIGA